MAGCNSSSNDGEPDAITLEGQVDDGTPTSPIANALCRFVTQNNTLLGTKTADTQGRYSFDVEPDFVGSIICTPPNLSALELSTFVNTMGQNSPLTENVTPATTMIAWSLENTQPADRTNAKVQSLAKLTNGDPHISLLAEAATIVFNALLDNAINFDFRTAFDELVTTGSLTQPELQPIAAPVEQAIAAAEQQRGVTMRDAACGHGFPGPPIANEGKISTSEDKPVSGTLDASACSGGPLTFRIVTQGNLGTANITDAATGAFIYTPNENANGPDTFRFVANEGTTDSAAATVTVTIRRENDAPTTADDTMIGTGVNTEVSVQVLENDADVDRDTLVIAAFTQGTGGTVTTDGATITYTPNAGFEGDDTFTYTVSDGQEGGTDEGTVKITVTSTNASPLARDDAQITDEGKTVEITALGNDTDADGNTLTITELFSLGTQGTLATNGMVVTYTPPSNGFNGTETFAYRVCDNGTPILCDIARVTVTVIPVNSPPTVANSIVDVRVDEDAPATRRDLSGTFSDVDIATSGDMLALTTVNSNTTLVTASLTDTTLTLSYTPNQSGVATITVRATDLGGLFVEDDFTVTVNPINDPPTIGQVLKDQKSVVGQRGIQMNLRQLMAVDDEEDPNCSQCTFTVANAPPHLTITNNGMVSGDMAFNAFSRGNGGGPTYNVVVTVTDSGDKTAPAKTASATFTWRVAQAQFDVPAGEDGDGDGDSADGDGGAEGDAGDGGNASPLAGAMCRFVDINGTVFQDNDGNSITDVADGTGKYLLTLPVDPDNDAVLRALEGFVECHPPGKPDLVVSTYLNTRGLRRNERIRGIEVSPATTVCRSVIQKLQSANPTADLVAVDARFRNEVDGLGVQSPQEKDQEADLSFCSGVETVRVVTTPLLEGTSPRNNRTGMAAYAASQFYLGVFKELEGKISVIDPDLTTNPETDREDFGTCPIPPENESSTFIGALSNYFQRQKVTPSALRELQVQDGDTFLLGRCPDT
jgi:hypothetical protein